MDKERAKRGCASEIDAKLQAKVERLPQSISKKIRRMKESGTWDEAIKYREAVVKQRKSRLEEATEELHEKIAEVICTDDPLTEATGEIKIVWLLNAVGELNSDDRRAEILEILNSKPQPIQGELERQLPGIRDWARQYLPLAV